MIPVTTEDKPAVRIYTTRICPHCIRAKFLLHRRSIPYEEVDVSGNAEMRAWLVQATGGLRTVPVIFIHDRPIGGSAELHQLDREGRLMPMVEGRTA
jgi:glutaredoxin 3